VTAIALTSGPMRATFLPDFGGRLASLTHHDYGNLIVPLEDAPFDPWQWPKAGAFPLFPFHGSVVDHAFRYGDEHIDLVANPSIHTGIALHGPAHRRAWQAMWLHDGSLQMSLNYAGDRDWPFSFDAIQRFTLSESALTVDLSLSNRGERTMPAGLGWHPYFAARYDCEIATDAACSWIRDPSTPHLPPLARHIEAKGVEVKSGPQAFSEWSYAEVGLDCGLLATMVPDQNLGHLVVLRTENYTCIEPVSHVAGALNHIGRIPNDGGLVHLEPGQSLSARVVCTFEARNSLRSLTP
jgi:aldose 1-epimerase